MPKSKRARPLPFGRIDARHFEYHGGVFSRELLARTLRELKDRSEPLFWTGKAAQFVIHGRVVEPRRKRYMVGDEGVTYGYSGQVSESHPWSAVPVLAEVRDAIRQKFGERPNFVLVNYYVDGKAVIGWHSDSKDDLEADKSIYSVSLGGARDFLVRRRSDQQKYSIKLHHGSLLRMRPGSQDHYDHCVPARAHAEPRFNLTFRCARVQRFGSAATMGITP